MTAGKAADPKEKFPEGKQARDELGAMAGVSGSTYSHAVTVLESAPEAVKDAVLDAEVRIGELTAAIPKSQGARTDLQLLDTAVQKSNPPASANPTPPAAKPKPTPAPEAVKDAVSFAL